MIGQVFLAAAMLSSGAGPSAAPSARPASFQPTGGATVRATASVRILSGVSFGPGRSTSAFGARRRSTSLTDGYGQLRRAEILEFQ